MPFLREVWSVIYGEACHPSVPYPSSVLEGDVHSSIANFDGVGSQSDTFVGQHLSGKEVIFPSVPRACEDLTLPSPPVLARWGREGGPPYFAPADRSQLMGAHV